MTAFAALGARIFDPANLFFLLLEVDWFELAPLEDDFAILPVKLDFLDELF